MKLLAAALLSLSFTGASAFEMKGLSIGQEMPACPDPTRDKADTAIPGGTVCVWSVDTIAGTPVKSAFFTLLDGRVVSFYIELSRSGRYENSDIRAAMVEKYGLPNTESKPHINQYRWGNRSKLLALDGWKGHLIAFDLDAVQRARTSHAKEQKNDL